MQREVRMGAVPAAGSGREQHSRATVECCSWKNVAAGADFLSALALLCEHLCGE